MVTPRFESNFVKSVYLRILWIGSQHGNMRSEECNAYYIRPSLRQVKIHF